MNPFSRRSFLVGNGASFPAWTIFEPFFALDAHRSERWRIERADGTALGLCGVWERCKSPAGHEATGFAMFTIKCDEHPLLKRFHKSFDENGKSNERRTPAPLREEGSVRCLDALVDEAPSFFTNCGSDGP